jgi:hypothetical protein
MSPGPRESERVPTVEHNPHTGLITRAIAVLVGVVGVILVGMVVAISTRALKLAVDEEQQRRK